MDLSVLKKKPFYLSDERIDKVKEIFDSMSQEEKVGQIFFMVGRSYDENYLLHITKDIKCGGMMVRPLEHDKAVNTIKLAQENSKIPLLIAANLESGGVGGALDLTKVGSNMMIAATNDSNNAYKLGEICAKEGKSIGINFAFAPVCDIDKNFRNPITNTRTFGRNQEMVKSCASNYLKACLEENIVCSPKHFPGDGVDERDQHLVSSINSLSVEEWDKSYGEIYKTLIEQGTKAIMVGHIMQPAYSKYLNPSLKDSDILPASLSKELLIGLLRGRLNFNGLIVSDATTMAGFNIPLPRNISVPLCIEAGCDMFLFTKNLEEDINFMKEGIKKGILSQTRVDEAVLRILATKASIGLLDSGYKYKDYTIDTTNDLKVAKEVAYTSITIIKKEEGVLPISPSKYKRILLHTLESGGNSLGYIHDEISETFKEQLIKEGFEVTPFVQKGLFEGLQESFNEVYSKYDLIIYLANLATKSNQTTVRIEWTNPMGVNVPIYPNSIKTIFISVENPYHLLDVPRVKTYINTYGTNQFTVPALVDLLLGREEFKGKDPVDSFCGKWDTRL